MGCLLSLGCYDWHGISFAASVASAFQGAEFRRSGVCLLCVYAICYNFMPLSAICAWDAAVVP
jgi:hypothetical protein